MTDGWDDETVLTALREALRARQAVPPGFIEAAQSVFAWHNIDAELAQLTYDSTGESVMAHSVRAEPGPIRALSFSSAHLTIELEVTPDSLIGQLVPAQAATVAVQPSTGVETTFPIDETGRFSISPIPPATFRLHCRTDVGLEVLTPWITL